MRAGNTGSLFLLALACVLCGCRVDDLRFAGIEVLDAGQPLPRAVAKWHPQSRVLKLSFSTAANLRALEQQKGLYVGADVYFCGNRSHELGWMHVVFDSNGPFT